MVRIQEESGESHAERSGSDPSKYVGVGQRGRLLLPTYLQGKTGAAYGAVIKIYQGVGFHYEHAFTPETYRAFLERLDLGHVTVEVIPGRLPVGLAVLQKPVEPSGGPF